MVPFSDSLPSTDVAADGCTNRKVEFFGRIIVTVGDRVLDFETIRGDDDVIMT